MALQDGSIYMKPGGPGLATDILENAAAESRSLKFLILLVVLVLVISRFIFACCTWSWIRERADVDWLAESLPGRNEEDFPDGICDCGRDMNICCKTTWCTTVAEAEIAYVTGFCGFWLYFISVELAMFSLLLCRAVANALPNAACIKIVELAMLTGVGFILKGQGHSIILWVAAKICFIPTQILRCRTRQHFKGQVDMEYNVCCDCCLLSWTPLRLCGVCQELRYVKSSRKHQQLVGESVNVPA